MLAADGVYETRQVENNAAVCWRAGDVIIPAYNKLAGVGLLQGRDLAGITPQVVEDFKTSRSCGRNV